MIENLQPPAAKLMELSANFVEQNHGEVSEFVSCLIYKSEGYFTRRESLKVGYESL